MTCYFTHTADLFISFMPWIGRWPKPVNRSERWSPLTTSILCRRDRVVGQNWTELQLWSLDVFGLGRDRIGVMIVGGKSSKGLTLKLQSRRYMFEWLRNMSGQLTAGFELRTIRMRRQNFIYWATADLKSKSTFCHSGSISNSNI